MSCVCMVCLSVCRSCKPKFVESRHPHRQPIALSHGPQLPKVWQVLQTPQSPGHRSACFMLWSPDFDLAPSRCFSSNLAASASAAGSELFDSCNILQDHAAQCWMLPCNSTVCLRDPLLHMLTVSCACLCQKLVMTAPAAHTHISVQKLTELEGQTEAVMSRSQLHSCIACLCSKAQVASERWRLTIAFSTADKAITCSVIGR